jgi:mono/diheme cytochrome c family protein
MRRYVSAIAVALGVVLVAPIAGAKAASQVERGKYLVELGGCNDCHTPGANMGHPNFKEALGGGTVGFFIPGLGVFVPPNLTPDKETGLGTWTNAQIIAAITTGKRPDGRELAPIMPWRGLSHLTHRDAEAIVAYLKSLPPVKHKVPGPFGPDEQVTGFVSTIVPGEVFNHMPKPGGHPPEHH